jgi:hypothetical protein
MVRSRSDREASCVLLRLLAEVFVPDGLLVIDLDERRSGVGNRKSPPKGIY